MKTTSRRRRIFVSAKQCALAITFVIVTAAAAAAQTNTFPASGNAGVGTTSPNSTLTVVGNAGAEANASFSSGLGLLGIDSGNGYLQLYDSTRTLRTYFSSRAGINNYINNGGNVGIGTTNPQWGRLQVNKSIRIDDDSASPTGSDTMMSAPFLYLGTTTGGNLMQYNGGGGLDLWQYNSGWGRTVTFAKNGNVGIGAMSPTSRLHIGGTNDNLFQVVGTGSGASDTVAHFSSAVGTNMIVRGNGYVGIGTINPAALLHVNGNAGIATTGTGGILAFQMRDGSTYGGLYGTGNVMRLWRADAGDVIGINSSGNVGIGNVSPSYKLDVSGQIRSSSGGFVFPDGTVQTTAGSGGSSQWSNNGVGINYSSGRVGISNNNPASLLYVGSGSVAAGPLPGINVATGGDTYVTASDGARTVFLGADLSGYGMVGTLSNHDFVVRSNNTERIRVKADGNVGIGTTNPSYKLQVVSGNGQFLSGDPTGSQLFFQVRPSSGKQGWLAFTEDGVADRWAVGIKNNDSKLYFSSGNIGSLTDRMSLDANGNLSVSGNIAAKYQDLAEWVPSAEQLSAGTVVVLDTTKSNQVISSTQSYDTRVAGVISAQPGITLGEGGEGKVLVATTGRVRVKVDASRGAIQIGDLLVTSDLSGVAMKSEAVNLGGVEIHRPGTIIGKALEPLTNGKGEILVLLSLQ